MISIAMATYNGSQYINEQIDSIVDSVSAVQGLEYEIVISDDGSNDGTIEIIKQYMDKNPNIKLYSGPKQGVIRNFENAIEKCCGEYVFLSDQDDVWLKPKVQVILDTFNKRPDITCIVHNVEIVDGSLNDTHETFFQIRKSNKGIFYNLIKNRYMGSAMAIRRGTLIKSLPIPINVPMHDQWIGLVNEIYGKSLYIDTVLGLYRRHGNNASSYDKHGTVTYMISTRFYIVVNLLKKVLSR